MEDAISVIAPMTSSADAAIPCAVPVTLSTERAVCSVDAAICAISDREVYRIPADLFDRGSTLIDARNDLLDKRRNRVQLSRRFSNG